MIHVHFLFQEDKDGAQEIIDTIK